ncbi:hypothetical protein MTBLM5_280009 [Magnetospirillum sp. LM-5]|uniref:hypothetical protein n=1 Tax=Magnetospirillum sp. LM-5 TaxID=2681466 RepID=UPI00137DE0F0|nr:hypothetical protein [Magnetospirillum sp. LM-5]CAA7618734.1 hypothetical protein MTBLM5_280009 [Magnetospirillum sp. LM-5]
MTFAADYHVHLRRSPCTANEMTVPAVLEAAFRCGLREVGVVNHLHPDTDLDIFRQARAEVGSYDGPRPPKVLIGAEIDLLDQDGNCSWRDGIDGLVDFVTLAPGHQQLEWVTGDFSQSPEEFLENDTRSIIQALRRHRYHVLVHPFIYVAFPKLARHYVETLRPGSLPSALIDELAATLVASDTAFEYHCRDIVVRPERLGGAPFVESYMSLVEALRRKGVRFVVGSDAHRLDQIPRSAAAPDWARNALFNT